MEFIIMFYDYVKELPLAAYKYRREFLSGFIIVCDEYNKWGIVNKSGKIIYNIQYTYPEIQNIIKQLVRRCKIEKIDN